MEMQSCSDFTNSSWTALFFIKWSLVPEYEEAILDAGSLFKMFTVFSIQAPSFL